jgi:hypothetical protein
MEEVYEIQDVVLKLMLIVPLKNRNWNTATQLQLAKQVVNKATNRWQHESSYELTSETKRKMAI